MNLFLSIITVNYNNLFGLKETINSVISQTYKNFEFIIIDGGSSDGSFQYLEKTQKHYSYFVSEKDKGIYNAMNKGIKVSKGEFLLFLNSGDVLTNKNSLKDFINSPLFKGDIIYGDYKFIKGDKKYPDVLTPLHFFKSSLPHQSSLIRKDLFQKFGYYNETFKIVSDKAFFIKCFLSNKVKFTHINYYLSLVDLSGISNNEQNKKKVLVENNIILKELYGKYYNDYIQLQNLIKENKELKRNTIQGILFRIKRKLSFLSIQNNKQK